MGVFTHYHHSVVDDDTIEQFFSAFIQSGRERAAYYCCAPRTPREHLQNVRSGGPWWLIYMNNIPAGCFYISDLQGGSGQAHFAYLPQPFTRAVGLPAPVAMSRYILASVLHSKHIDNTFILQTLTGLTPAWNKAAVHMLKKCGGVIAAELPKVCFCYDSKCMSNGIVSYFTRNKIPAEWAEI
ncbi:hypothetical protein LJB93_03075 [Desulfovibrio sp. OttesenSCG-928-F07]|nr:hypothetical protein [Desulfovibrio sp. OttesenSCG-928-F07]